MKTTDLSIEYFNTARVKPYAKNARAHPPEQVAKIVASIRAVGFTKPILVDERNEILAGHGAHMAAQQLEMAKVPVIVRRGLTQAQKRAYRLADNKIAEGSGWDNAILAVEFADLKAMGADLAMTAFDPDEIELVLKPPPGAPDAEPPVPANTGRAASQAGDLWLLGSHRLICGDSTKTATLKALMHGNQAQCVFTDPPYGVSYQSPSGAHEVLKGDELRRGQLAHMLHGALSAALPHTVNDAGWYIWHASSTREEFSKAMRDVGLVELATLIWAKPGIVLGWADYRWAHEPCFYAARQGVKPAFYGDRTNQTVWRVGARSASGEATTAIGAGVTVTTKEGAEIHIQASAPKGRKVRHLHLEGGGVLLQSAGGAGDDLWEVGRDAGHGRENDRHPTQKPVELARRAITNSTRESEGVLDMFAGAASTIIACEQLKRVGYAVELDPKYVDVGIRRWQEFTGKQAIHAKEKKTFDAIAKARSATGKRAGGKEKSLAA